MNLDKITCGRVLTEWIKFNLEKKGKEQNLYLLEIFRKIFY